MRGVQRGEQLQRSILLPVTALLSASCRQWHRAGQALSVWVDKAVDHEADHGQGDHRLRNLGQLLIILGQPPPSPEPTERSLNNPSTWQDDEASYARNAADNNQRQAKQEAGKQDSKAVIATVSEYHAQPAVERLQTLEQIPCAFGILNVGRMHNHTEQQPLRVDRNLALAPLDLLGGIVAARPPFSVVFTLWLSMMAAVGLASRPSPSRNKTTRWWRMLSQTPAARNARK